MNYEQFCHHLHKSLIDDFPVNTVFRFHKVKRNNGVSADALFICAPGDTCTPVFYVNDYYTSYLNGQSPSQICEQIGLAYMRETAVSIFSPEDFTSYEQIAENIVFRIVNADGNRELLCDAPHRIFLDLAIIYYILVFAGNDSIGTTHITNRHLEVWGRTEEDIFQRAMYNTPRLLPSRATSMEEVLRGLCSEIPTEAGPAADVCALPEGCVSPMYVLSNDKNLYGAAVMVYPEFPEQLYHHYSAYYLLPSSVHELILIPDSPGLCADSLLATVREINRSVLNPEDFLSDHIYYYEKEHGLRLISHVE